MTVLYDRREFVRTVAAAAVVRSGRQALKATVDAAVLRKRLEALSVFGSHIDSVPSSGNFDGDLGSLAALGALERCDAAGIRTRHPLEMVVWAHEEGVAFGRGLAGSRIVAGDLQPADLSSLSRNPPAIAASEVQSAIERSAAGRGLRTVRMPSGAGHDAQMMAQLAPMGMIFVPSVGGISHSPKELTRWEDCANGADVLLRTILELDELQCINSQLPPSNSQLPRKSCR